MKAIVTGMIVTSPVGGVAWDYGQYALSLEQLGFEVYYLEDPGIPAYSYNPETRMYEEDPSYGVEFLQRSLKLLSPNLAQRWHYRAVDGQSYGLDADAIADVAADATLFLNVSGGSLLRDEYQRCRNKVLIDTDPGWNHFVIFPQWDKKSTQEQLWGWRAHDHFFTYAHRLGQADCPLPTFGLNWHSTRPPVVLDCWNPQPPAKKWTTVMTWNHYPKPIIRDGVKYGSKEMEFGRIEALPTQLPGSFEVLINVNGEAPVTHWQKLGWSVVDAEPTSASAATYRTYIERSRGEFAVAKNIYVATRSGWFSCRSVCYLAAGRPVVVQDTGFSEYIQIGEGLLSFRNLWEAVGAIATIEKNYTYHQQAARELARTQFDSRLVLSEILEKIAWK